MTHAKLTVVAKIVAKPTQRDLVKAALIELIAPTRAEKGCINYDLHEDHHNDHLFLFYENWQTRELWQDHLSSPHLATFNQTTKDAIHELVIHEMTHVQ